MRQKRRSYRDGDDDDGDAISEDLAAVNDRLDELTRHIERMAQSNAGRRHDDRGGEPSADRVAEALARLDRRLDQVISEGRAAAHEIERRRSAPPPPAPPLLPTAPAPSRGPANWAAQISARQRALDGGPAEAPAPAAPAYAAMPQGPASDLSGLEHQLRQINSQIAALHQPYGDAFAALRSDLAEIGHALTDAVPRHAIEALESQVRALGERIDRSKQAGADGAILGGVEHGLAEVRDALRRLTPAEGLAGFDEAVRVLSHKIDQIGAGQGGDPAAFRQLEQAVVSLRGAMSNVASEGAMSQLAAEVHGLAGRFERAAAESSSDALGKLEARIAALMESGRAMPPELEGAIRSLSERLDRMTLSQGDQLAIGSLEDRIAKLSEKLDAADARLSQLGALERGMADLLVHLEEMRNGGGRGLRAAARAEAPSEPPPAAPPPAAVAALPVPPPRPAPAAPPMASNGAASALDLIPAPHGPPEPQAKPPGLAPPRHAPDTAEPVETQVMAPPPAVVEPHRVQPKSGRPIPRPPEPRRPINPDLPPDTPIEPGTGAPRLRSGSAAARIAASEAALGSARPAPEATGGKSAAIAAARNAKSSYLDSPVKVPRSFSVGKPAWLKWPFKSKPKPELAPDIAPPPELFKIDAPEDRAPTGQRVLKLLKSILIAASVTIIIVGAALTLMDMLMPDEPSAPPAVDTSAGPPPSAPPVPSRPMPTPGGVMLPPMPAPSAPDRDPTGSIQRTPSFFEPSTVITPPKPPTAADVTGSVARPVAPPKPPTSAPATPAQATPAHSTPSSGAAAALPPSISPALRAAAAANEPAAEYEMAVRYAEGRGVPQNLPEAARWFERAANAGFVPAQFRLAGLNEKGDGVKKDLQAARRLYLSAANHGHAKAMHNLAVLYAEGVDGRPDYKMAAQWFRKAAGYGIADSQYNLAILYARGIGIEPNLAESYKWFALAAGNGDADAAKKRDEVAARLDQQTLVAARLAAQTFTPDREPEEATSLKAPPGGWDRTPAQAAKPKAKTPASPTQ